MQDNDNIKYTSLGLAVGGLLLAIWTSSIFALIALGLSALITGWIIYKEGLGNTRTGSRRAALAVQFAIVVLAFAFPFRLLVKPALNNADRNRAISAAKASELKADRASLAELESREGVQVSDAGLQREERRNLALQLDVQNLRQRVEFKTAPAEEAAKPESDLLVLLQSRINHAKEKLERKKQRLAEKGQTATDFSKEPRLGLEEVEPKSAGLALGELDVIVEVLDRALDAGIRKIEAITPGGFEVTPHDVLPKIDVATRKVTFEVLGEVESIARFLHELQSRAPYVGVASMQLPAVIIKEGAKGKKEEKQVIQGEYFTARVEVQAFYGNDGQMSFEPPTGAPAEGTGGDGKEKRSWFR